LDANPIPGRELDASLGRQPLLAARAEDRIPPRRARSSAGEPPRTPQPAIGEKRRLGALEDPELADDSVAARIHAASTGPATERRPLDDQGVGLLEDLDRGVLS